MICQEQGGSRRLHHVKIVLRGAFAKPYQSSFDVSRSVLRVIYKILFGCFERENTNAHNVSKNALTGKLFLVIKVTSTFIKIRQVNMCFDFRLQNFVTNV